MGNKSSDVPAPPPLTPEERGILDKWGISLDKYGDMLDDANINTKETQDMIKELSGLWKTVDVPGTPGSTVYNQALHDQFASGRFDGMNAALTEAGKQGTPSFTMQGLTKALDAAKADPVLAAKYGLQTVSAGTPGTTKKVMDDVAIKKLRDKIGKNADAQDKVVKDALAVIDGIINRPMTDYEKKNMEVGLLELEQYQLALEGKAPVSEGLKQEIADSFPKFKEAMGRNGVKITGDSWETAGSNSTPGVQAIAATKKNIDLAMENERFGRISYGGPMSINRTASNVGAEGQRFNQAGSMLGLPGGSTGLGMALNMPQMNPAAYGQMGQGYGGMLGVLGNERMMGYGATMQNAGLASQNRGSLFQGLGMGGSAMLASGNPWGAAMIGAGAIGSYLMR